MSRRTRSSSAGAPPLSNAAAAPPPAEAVARRRAAPAPAPAGADSLPAVDSAGPAASDRLRRAQKGSGRQQSADDAVGSGALRAAPAATAAAPAGPPPEPAAIVGGLEKDVLSKPLALSGPADDGNGSSSDSDGGGQVLRASTRKRAAAAAATITDEHQQQPESSPRPSRPRRRRKATAGDEETAAAADTDSPEPRPPKQPSKKKIAEQVAVDARLGMFAAEGTIGAASLAASYSHVQLYVPAAPKLPAAPPVAATPAAAGGGGGGGGQQPPVAAGEEEQQHQQLQEQQEQQEDTPTQSPDPTFAARLDAQGLAQAAMLDRLRAAAGAEGPHKQALHFQMYHSSDGGGANGGVEAAAAAGGGGGAEALPLLAGSSDEEGMVDVEIQGASGDEGDAAVDGGGDATGSGGAAVVPAAAPAAQQQQAARELLVLPNLGYACLNMTLRQYDIFTSRSCVKRTFTSPGGRAVASSRALANARDLVPLIRWNEAHGIRFFRLSSCIFPWMTFYEFEELEDWEAIQQALQEAGALARSLGHRLTFHPSEFCKLAGERPDWVTQSVKELEVHSKIFDEMGMLPATPHNKINIHVGGTYGDKDAALARFIEVVNTRLSPNCKARLTVENDDRPGLYSVRDLLRVHQATGCPIVFDFHHHGFCTGGWSEREAFEAAVGTWPPGVRPVVHWSESPPDPKMKRNAHSDYVRGPMFLYGRESSVDVMVESKAKELAVLRYRQAVLEEGGRVAPAPGQPPARRCDIPSGGKSGALRDEIESAAAAAAVENGGSGEEGGEEQEGEEGVGSMGARSRQGSGSLPKGSSRGAARAAARACGGGRRGRGRGRGRGKGVVSSDEESESSSDGGDKMSENDTVTSTASDTTSSGGDSPSSSSSGSGGGGGSTAAMEVEASAPPVRGRGRGRGRGRK